MEINFDRGFTKYGTRDYYNKYIENNIMTRMAYYDTATSHAVSVNGNFRYLDHVGQQFTNDYFEKSRENGHYSRNLEFVYKVFSLIRGLSYQCEEIYEKDYIKKISEDDRIIHGFESILLNEFKSLADMLKRYDISVNSSCKIKPYIYVTIEDNNEYTDSITQLGCSNDKAPLKVNLGYSSDCDSDYNSRNLIISAETVSSNNPFLPLLNEVGKASSADMYKDGKYMSGKDYFKAMWFMYSFDNEIEYREFLDNIKINIEISFVSEVYNSLDVPTFYDMDELPVRDFMTKIKKLDSTFDISNSTHFIYSSNWFKPTNDVKIEDYDIISDNYRKFYNNLMGGTIKESLENVFRDYLHDLKKKIFTISVE